MSLFPQSRASVQHKRNRSRRGSTSQVARTSKIDRCGLGCVGAVHEVPLTPAAPPICLRHKSDRPHPPCRPPDQRCRLILQKLDRTDAKYSDID
ncbi:hypothetical protein [Leptolyngbya ohadii]|uniref:hypothetical protein n=1 Tax=Leptolyngbya ohadii TaxID=1962290 RepID=UPI00117B7FBA|nr:hypothetical protein [Leptolyngbya ohadii]